MRVRVLAALAAAVLLASGCSVTPESVTPQPTAQPIEKTGRLPDIELPGITGGTHDLGSLRGPMVVTLWASWCAPCKKELPIIADYARENGEVKVFGIDYQDPSKKKALALMGEAEVAFPVAYDFDGASVRAMGLPKMLMLDRTGKVVFNEYVPITSREQLVDLVEKHLGVSTS